MAKKRTGGRSLDVADLVELVGALANIRNGNSAGHGAPLTDPSINVKEAMLSAVSGLRSEADLTSKYEEKIRNSDRTWQEKLDAQKDRAAEAARGQEAGRIDAKIQDIVQQQAVATQELKNTATTLAKTVSDTAETARKTVEVAAQQQSELIGQVRDSVTEVRNLVTNFIAAGGATKEATTERVTEVRWNERQRSQRVEWQVGLYVAAGIAISGFALKALGILH